MVRFDQKLAVDIIDDAIAVVADFRDDRRKSLFSFGQVFVEKRVALLSFATFANIQDRESLIVRDPDILKALRMFLVLINQFVVGLLCPDFVKAISLKFILRVDLFSFFMRRITAV